MKAKYLNVADDALLAPLSNIWDRVEANPIDLYPTPIAMAKHLSPFMALSSEHGKVSKLWVRLAHSKSKIAVHLSWEDPSKDDEIKDLDQFVDGVAVMFPLTPQSEAMTMGNSEHPVNAWLWKADKPEPFDVIAHGFGTSQKRPGEQSGLKAGAEYRDGRWHVVFQRPLRASLITSRLVNFAPGADSEVKMSFAVWEGGNKDRSAQKAFSGAWKAFKIDL